MMIRTVILILTVGLFFASSAATAAVGNMGGARVTTVLLADEGRWGGCMARFDTEIAAATGLDCPGAWVTFSCTGDFTTTNNARQMFDAAQISLAADLRTFVQIDDAAKHNGYCFAKRIDLVR